MGKRVANPMHRLSLVYHALSPTASGQDAVLGGLAERYISLAAPFFFSHFSAQRAHFNPVHLLRSPFRTISSWIPNQGPTASVAWISDGLHDYLELRIANIDQIRYRPASSATPYRGLRPPKRGAPAIVTSGEGTGTGYRSFDRCKRLLQVLGHP
jgi:hypothetical protein